MSSPSDPALEPSPYPPVETALPSGAAPVEPQQQTEYGRLADQDTVPRVGLIMGSQSDWETLSHAATMLDTLGIPFETRIISAHRTPDRLVEYAGSARARGIRVIIAGAGGAAHLPGMCASWTSLPVLGVPMESQALRGMDSLLSIVQMPAGVPVGTLAIGRPGAVNAAILAGSILSLNDNELATRIDTWRSLQTASVPDTPQQ